MKKTLQTDDELIGHHYMNMIGNKTIVKAFWRGYGRVLEMFPVHQTPARRFMFRGRDLSKISASEALDQDWFMVNSSMASVLKEIGEQEDERAIGQGAR